MNYYDILEVNKTASKDVIKAAYRILAQKYHPDKNSSKEAEEKMKKINTAYDCLFNDEKRKEYDLSLKENNNFSDKKQNTETNQKQREEDHVVTFGIEIINYDSNAISLLEISKLGVTYNNETILAKDIEFFATKAESQHEKNNFNKLGNLYSIIIGGKNKKIKIIIDNKHNNGEDDRFVYIVDLLIQEISNEILKKIVKKIQTDGGHSIESFIEFNAKGIFLIEKKKNTLDWDKLFIPYSNLKVEVYNGKIALINKINLEKIEIENKNFVKNYLIIPNIIETLKTINNSFGEVGEKESIEIKKWKEEVNYIKEKNKFEQLIKEVDSRLRDDFTKLKWSSDNFENLYPAYCEFLKENERKIVSFDIFINIAERFISQKINEDNIDNKKIALKEKKNKNFYNVLNLFSVFIVSLMFIATSTSIENNNINTLKQQETSKEKKEVIIQQNKQALNFLNLKKYNEAFNLFAFSANQGDPYAQFNLGVMYNNGQGVQQNYKEALRLYTMAANQGSAEAQNNLGIMYYNGQGVQQNHKEAIRLYTMAANQGSAEAQNNLGEIYEDGLGIQQNFQEAIRLYALAANQGNTYAQFNLGNMFKNGKGIQQNYKEAIRLYTMAANQGNAYAQNNLGMMYRDGQGVQQNIQEALKLFMLSANQGNLYAKNNLEIESLKLDLELENNNQ